MLYRDRRTYRQRYDKPGRIRVVAVFWLIVLVLLVLALRWLLP